MSRCYTGPPRLPSFNITCNVWNSTGTVPPFGAPTLAAVPCQLRFGEMIFTQLGTFAQMFVLVPKLTDIAKSRGGPASDLIECPAGSGRYYNVQFVDDVAKGFANEYRCVVVTQASPWPVPTP